MRFCRGVLPSVHARLCVPAAALCPRLTPDFAFLSRRFAIGSRLSFSSLRKKRRLTIACVPVPPGRDRHSHVLAALFGYLPWRVHFGFARFFMAISTSNRGRGKRRTGNGERGYGVGGAPLCVFAQPHWHCRSFRGEYVGGCAPPNLRQRVFDSLDSLHAAAGLGWCGFAGRHPGTRKDPAESNLCSAGSGCITMLPIRSIVQTRAAPKRRRVGLTRAERRGSRHCRPPPSGEESG